MKKIFISFSLAMLLMTSLPINCQSSIKSAIQQIDSLEKVIVSEKGKDWLADFYNIWENGINDPKYNEIMVSDEYGKSLKFLLEDDNPAVIINGWLYVLSYQPNDTKIEYYDEDYRNVYSHFEKNDVWLYKKSVRMNSLWELASFNPVFRNLFLAMNKNEDVVTFNPTKGKDENITNQAIKSTAYKNVVFILGSMRIKCNGQFHRINEFIILSPEEVYANGSIYFDVKTHPDDNVIELHLDYNYYPKKFTGQINGGKTITTIDNNGKPKNINIYLGRDSSGNKINDVIVSFDGDYGWSITQPTDHA
jgi:hypothetical protein